MLSTPPLSFDIVYTPSGPPSEQQTMRILAALDRFVAKMRVASNSSQSSGSSLLSEFEQDQGSSDYDYKEESEEELAHYAHGDQYDQYEGSYENADQSGMDLGEISSEEDYEDTDADDQLMDTTDEDEDESSSESDWKESVSEYSEAGYTFPNPVPESAFQHQHSYSLEGGLDKVPTTKDIARQPRRSPQVILEEVQSSGSGRSDQPPLKLVCDLLTGLGGEYGAACLSFKVAHRFQIPAHRNRYVSVKAVAIEGQISNHQGYYSQKLWVLKSSSIERSVGPEISAYLRISQERAKLDKLGYAFLMECEATYVADDRWCLLMPLAVCDLRDYIPRLEGKDEVRAVMAQLALALATIHSIGITHGDIKPENVMVDRIGNIKLMDFGSSHVRHTAAPLERSAVYPSIVFTVAYAAPERRTGTSSATDYWSLGCVFYELAMRTQSEKPQALGDHALFELIDIRRWVEGYWSGDDPRSHLPRDSCVLDPESMSLLFGLLCPDADHRFTIDDMLNHAYFSNVDQRDQTNSEFQSLHRDLYRGEVDSLIPTRAKFLDTAAQSPVARQKILIQTDRHNLWQRS